MITFERAGVSLGDRRVLAEISLTVPEGALAVFVGPSGAGKSTLLKTVNRMVETTEGSVRVRGKDVRDFDPVRLRRSIGYALQSTGLFPHRSVADNVATVPRLLGRPEGEVADRVAAMLRLVHLDPAEFGPRRPSSLSGGQAQRVGIARALAGDPDLLLMDEPFGAVDPITRRALRTELRRIHRETGKTILFVTHDPTEALDLADLLVVLQDGRMVAAGPPVDLARVRQGFVADLLGPDRALRLLSGRRVREVAHPAPPAAGAPAVAAEDSLAEALSRMLIHGVRQLAVHDETGRVTGSVAWDSLLEAGP